MQPRQRAARILPDGPAFGYGVLASVILVFAGAFSISFQGQSEMAATYLGLEGPIRFMVPLVIDTSLLVYAGAALIRRARGESVRWAILATGFWTAVSIGANMVHALQPDSIIVTAALSTLAPLAILMSSLTIESLLVAPPGVGEKLDREADLSAELDAQRSEHAATIADHIKEATRLQGLIDRLERENAKSAAAVTPPTTTPRSSAAKPLTAVPDLASTAGEKESRAAHVLELRAAGKTIPAIASAVGVSASSIKRILSAATTSAA